MFHQPLLVGGLPELNLDPSRKLVTCGLSSKKLEYNVNATKLPPASKSRASKSRASKSKPSRLTSKGGSLCWAEHLKKTFVPAGGLVDPVTRATLGMFKRPSCISSLISSRSPSVAIVNANQ